MTSKILTLLSFTAIGMLVIYLASFDRMTMSTVATGIVKLSNVPRSLDTFVGVWEMRTCDVDSNIIGVTAAFNENGSYTLTTRTRRGKRDSIVGQWKVTGNGVFLLLDEVTVSSDSHQKTRDAVFGLKHVPPSQKEPTKNWFTHNSVKSPEVTSLHRYYYRVRKNNEKVLHFFLEGDGSMVLHSGEKTCHFRRRFR